MKPHAELFCGLDVKPLIAQLEEHTDLWAMHTLRQDYPGSAHAETECIFVRGPRGFTPELYFNDLGSVDFLAMAWLTEAMPLVEEVCSKLGVTAIGRVLIVKLKAGGTLDPHVDEGLYADHFSRLHIPLTTNSACFNITAGKFSHWAPGTVWWFDHKCRHYAVNGGETDRVHLIVDVVIPNLEDILSPGK